MNLPKAIKIGFRYYKIEVKKSREIQGYHGKSDCSRSVILIDWEDEDQIKRNTLLHEIIHCIWNEYSLNLKGEDFEERGIGCLTNGLMQVMLDNPELIEVFKND